jgi:hypothetical protein
MAGRQMHQYAITFVPVETVATITPVEAIYQSFGVQRTVTVRAGPTRADRAQELVEATHWRTS